MKTTNAIIIYFILGLIAFVMDLSFRQFTALFALVSCLILCVMTAILFFSQDKK